MGTRQLDPHPRFHGNPLGVWIGNEGKPLETEMETRGQNRKRDGNEGLKLETGWKLAITTLGNEACILTPPPFPAPPPQT